MKVSELIEKLQRLPPDAIVTAFDADSDCEVAVTGLMYQPDGFYTVFREEDESMQVVNAPTVEIHTDD
jgi:hypothetical protein